MTDAKFLSFEGIDGCGKSTQAKRLAGHLTAAGQEVVLTREPGGSPGAEAIRQLLLTGATDKWSAETELLLFTAARRDHLERTITPALSAGKIVVCDRFADSTRVYQGATRGDLRGKVDQLHTAMIGRDPDMTLMSILTWLLHADWRATPARIALRISACRSNKNCGRAF